MVGGPRGAQDEPKFESAAKPAIRATLNVACSLWHSACLGVSLACRATRVRLRREILGRAQAFSEFDRMDIRMVRVNGRTTGPPRVEGIRPVFGRDGPSGPCLATRAHVIAESSEETDV